MKKIFARSAPFRLGELDHEVLVTESGPALALRIGAENVEQLPPGHSLTLWLRDDETLFPAGPERWSDDAGHLALEARLEGDHFRALLPFVALPSPCPRTVELLAGLHDEDGELVEEEVWELELPSRAEREEGHLLGAFVGAAAEVLGPLSKARGQKITEFLGEAWRLDEHGLLMLSRLLERVRQERSNAELWEPSLEGLDPDDQAHLAEFIIEVAKADGGPTEEEQEAAEALFESFDMEVEIWRECLESALEEPEPEPLADSLAEAFAALELSESADWEAVRKAWRKLAADYHPDRVAHLAKGFQDFATARTQAVNAAYEVLRRHFER